MIVDLTGYAAADLAATVRDLKAASVVFVFPPPA